jgi:DNA-binding transcriptional LysR family regulator
MFEPQPLFPLALVQCAAHDCDGAAEGGRKPPLQRVDLARRTRQGLPQTSDQHLARRGLEQQIGQPFERTGCRGGCGSRRAGRRPPSGQGAQHGWPGDNPRHSDPPERPTFHLDFQQALGPGQRAQSRATVHRKRPK